MKQACLFITGDVIGVGFRAYVKNQAKALNLTGFTQNVYNPEKGVECVVEGDENAIKQFIVLCKRGPEIAWVDNVQVEWKKAAGNFENFSIV